MVPSAPSPNAHPTNTTSTVVATTKTASIVFRKTPRLGLARPTATIACSSPLYSTGTSSGRSRRQRKSALSTVAHARLMDGRTPQKHTDWRVE